MPVSKLGFIVGLVTESLSRNYPDIDSDAVASGVDLGNLEELVQALMNTTGLVRTTEPAALMTGD